MDVQELQLGDIVWKPDYARDRYTVVAEAADTNEARVSKASMHTAARFGPWYVGTGSWRYDRDEICPFTEDKHA